MSLALCVLYAVVLLILSIYGVHRSYLVFMSARLRPRLELLKKGVPPLPPLPELRAAQVPYVTIQLPLYNESTVVERLLQYVSRIEYPRERLEIQVLDDSTDETTVIAARAVAALQKTGLDIVYMHRTNRVGYKAGALAAGLKVAKGELVALFDADFMPPPEFLRAVVPHFDAADVAMVQTRWGHVNRDHSILTRVSALMLDGHHLIENRVRHAAGWLFNFAGTGGIWRKCAILSAGGWEHDTLTEDLDLSYRAQLLGWRFIYREDIVTPAELPEEVSAFRAQQFRWAVGTVQTSRKLLRRVLSSSLSRGARVEAFFHLTPHFAYPLTLTLSIILLPLVLLLPVRGSLMLLAIDIPLFFGTTGSLAAFYALAERAQGRRARDAFKVVPALIAVGVGLTPLVTRALFRGFGSMAGEFVRTPKKGDNTVVRYKAKAETLPYVETAMCFVSIGSTLASIRTGHFVATPFAALFAAGFGYMAVQMWREHFARVRSAAIAAATPVLAAATPALPTLADAETTFDDAAAAQ
jgi:cellulose synthase/poly-beta-1,6-N-acetylglucosamine synthase-like glycosyltransferase